MIMVAGLCEQVLSERSLRLLLIHPPPSKGGYFRRLSLIFEALFKVLVKGGWVFSISGLDSRRLVGVDPEVLGPPSRFTVGDWMPCEPNDKKNIGIFLGCL